MRIFLMIWILHLSIISNGQSSLELDTYQTLAGFDFHGGAITYPEAQLVHSTRSPSPQFPHQVNLYEGPQRSNSENRILSHSIQLDQNTLTRPVIQTLPLSETIIQDQPYPSIVDAIDAMIEKVNYPSTNDIIRADYSLVFVKQEKGTGFRMGYLIEISRMDESYGLGVGIIIGLK